MRVSRGLSIWLAVHIAAAASAPIYARQDDAKPGDAKHGDQRGPVPKEAGAKGADAKETRLAMDDIRDLRRKRTAAGQVADKVAEQGRSFEVTDDVARELRGLGFAASQIAAIKDA